jgi:guanylate kinase
VGRFVILSGPSCVGKGPLCAALRRCYPDAAACLHKLVLYNDRAMRPVERDGVDYHFRPRAEIERLRARDGFLVMEVRGDLQAVDLAELDRLLAEGDAFFEGNPFVAHALLHSAAAERAETLSIFLSPLSRQELLDARARGASLADVVAGVMRAKLIGRTHAQKGTLTDADLAEVERRCASAFRELGFAHEFDYVLVNHDGEDSPHWTAEGPPTGDARRTLEAFAALLAGKAPAAAKTWEKGFPC